MIASEYLPKKSKSDKIRIVPPTMETITEAMKKLKFNIITVSIGGGIFHNIGQLFAACLILKSLNIFYYLPVLLITGTIFSVATGICANILYKRLSKII